MNNISKDLQKLNTDLFSKEMIRKGSSYKEMIIYFIFLDLVPKIRVILRDELGK
jgi:hypothetical protein